MTFAHDPRAEAQALVGDADEARVLEPSPPAVEDGEHLADDPVAGRGDGRLVVGPPATSAVTWPDRVRRRPELAGWVAEHWLGAWRRLGPLAPNWAATRAALHRLAVYVLSPARRRVNDKLGLRDTAGGLGTPFLGAGEQVRLAGTRLVRQRGTSVEPGRVQLWPEHFDAGFDCLPAARRVPLGAWNAEHFKGALLAYGDLVAG